MAVVVVVVVVVERDWSRHLIQKTHWSTGQLFWKLLAHWLYMSLAC